MSARSKSKRLHAGIALLLENVLLSIAQLFSSASVITFTASMHGILFYFFNCLI